MLLALYVGNTHVVVGLMEGREVRRNFRIATRRDNAVGDYAVALSQLLELAEVDRQEVEQVVTWLTGYSPDDIARLACSDIPYAAFFQNAPAMNPDRTLITGKINYNEEPQLIQRFGIDTIPTLMLFKNGEVLGSVVAPGSKAAIETFIRETLAQ